MRWRLPLLAAVCLAFAQPLQGGWIRTYEVGFFSLGYSVRQTLDSGYIVVGEISEEEESDGDLLMIKTDSLGDTLWTRTYGGGSNDVGKCVQQTKDGGYIILGFANIEGNIWPAGDIWLLKTDSEGDTIWTRIYRGYNFPHGGWVEQTSDGGYVFTSNWDNAYLLLLKTNKDGNTLWSYNYNWTGDVRETGYCVRQTKDGGYIVASNAGLFKTDSDGDSLWLKPWGGRCVQQASDEGYVLTAHAGPGRGDLWIGKTDADGDSLWVRLYGGGEEEDGYCVEQTSDGGYIIVGETRSFGQGNYDVWLLKTDANGDTLWTRTYGGEGVDWAYSVQQTLDSGYIITGMSNLFSDDWAGDVLLIKTDSLGYVGVEEPVTPETHLDWRILGSVGHQIILQYENRPQGFAASIFDVTGRKVDELRSSGLSGIVTWGEGHQLGVYFIKENSNHPTTIQKVILLR